MMMRRGIECYKLPKNLQKRFGVDIEHFTVVSEPPTPKGEYILRMFKILTFS